MKQTTLDRCAQVAYGTFVIDMRELAPELAAMQPDWAHMPEIMKQAWRNLVEAALRESAKGQA